MGQRLTKNRRISKDRVRKLRIPKNKIIIAVEGKNKTEKTYFSNFDDGKKHYSISFAKGNYTDPVNLVKMLIIEIKKLGLDLENNDEAYCIFDTDIDIQKNILINDAIILAKENNIKVITSNPSIEIWFLLHFEYTTSRMNNKELIKRLKKYYPNYDKNINIFKDINQNVKEAIKNAKKLEEYQINNNREIKSVEANPNTEIYKVVEKLL